MVDTAVGLALVAIFVILTMLCSSFFYKVAEIEIFKNEAIQRGHATYDSEGEFVWIEKGDGDDISRNKKNSTD